MVYHELDPPITAHYIRFQPVSWFAHISMRVELYGCLGNVRGSHFSGKVDDTKIKRQPP